MYDDGDLATTGGIVAGMGAAGGLNLMVVSAIVGVTGIALLYRMASRKWGTRYQ